MRGEREDSIIYAHPRTHEFLRAAIEDGAVIRTLEKVEKSQLAKTVRNMNVMGIYFGSPATHADIAAIYCSEFGSRQGAGQIVNKNVAILWSNCSPEIQERFPLDEIKMGKPLGRRSRERLSRAGGGLACRVAELLEKGLEFEEVKKELGLPGCERDRLRRVLKEWGLKIPYVKTLPAENRKFAETLQAASSDPEIQEVLDQVNFGFYNHCLRNENPPLISVSKAARTAGLRFRPQQVISFVGSLVKANIPVGHIQKTIESGHSEGRTQNYYLIAIQHLERAQEVLSKLKSA